MPYPGYTHRLFTIGAISLFAMLLNACGVPAPITSVQPAASIAPGASSTPTAQPAPPTETPSANIGNGPLEQERIRICVAAADDPLQPGVLDGLRDVLLQEVAQRPDFVQMNQRYFNGNEPAIEEGCPGPMTILSPDWIYAGGKGGAPYRVDTPSPYFLWVWIAGEQEAHQAFGNDFPRRTSQESMCQGDACHDVNSAIYLTPAELADRERVAQSLAWGLGFQP